MCMQAWGIVAWVGGELRLILRYEDVLGSIPGGGD